MQINYDQIQAFSIGAIITRTVSDGAMPGVSLEDIPTRQEDQQVEAMVLATDLREALSTFEQDNGVVKRWLGISVLGIPMSVSSAAALAIASHA